jgi:SAM-dependent methyltransferase
MPDPDHLATNRAHWDAMAAVHGDDGVVYDSAALVAGRDWLGAPEDAAVREAVGDVAGLDVLHVQCHIGFDTISLARRGARVTGLDFSPASLAKAAALAQRCGVQIEWVQADATDPPASLAGRFDLVYATIGVICWIADVDAWMRAAAAALRPGGSLVFVELHPMFQMVGGVDPVVIDFPWNADAPRRFDEPGSYADAGAPVAATETYAYARGIGRVVTAAVDAGLRVRSLREHDAMAFDPRGGLLVREDDGLYRLRLGGEVLPLLFALVADRA